MPMRYAYQPDVLANLRVSETDAATVEYLVRIENALADAFDHKVGRTWGYAAQPTTRVFAVGREARTVVFSTPARHISGVAFGGTFDGAAYAGETAEPAWNDEFNANGLIYGVSRLYGVWPPQVRVTAVWASDAEETVPDDVRHALTMLTAKQYRKETSTPADMIGPDGMFVPTPDAWNDGMVKAVVEKHAIVKVVF